MSGTQHSSGISSNCRTDPRGIPRSTAVVSMVDSAGEWQYDLPSNAEDASGLAHKTSQFHERERIESLAALSRRRLRV